jgi:hypothetical protein
MIGNYLAANIGNIPFNGHIPPWPQLHQFPEERMIVQFTEWMPALERETVDSLVEEGLRE